jgi:predicted small lipoprotein YifL
MDATAMRRLLLALLLVSAIAALAGCDSKGPLERAPVAVSHPATVATPASAPAPAASVMPPADDGYPP